MECKTVLVVLYIILRCVLETVDLGLDWDFYAEVVNSDQKSIIRAEKVKWTILGFAVFGTIMFVVTFIFAFIVISYCKRREGNVSEAFYQKVMDVLSIFSFICIWLEDLPQIVLAVVVAVKSTELISDVQLVKAWYTLAEAVIESIITLVQLRPCCDNKPGGWRKVLMILELIGNILILLVSAFLLIELYQDNFKETYPQQNNATIFNITTTWTTPISST